MKEKVIKILRRQWIVIWLVAAIILLTSLSASAIYVGSFNSMKRVVVSSSGMGKMFSSDWMEESTLYRTRHFQDSLTPAQISEGATYDVPVHVYNYDRRNPGKFYGKEIKYTIKAEIVTATGEAITDPTVIGNRTINIQCGSETIALSANTRSGQSSQQTLASTSAISNLYTVKFSGNWNLEADAGICVKVIAELDTSGTEKYKDLANLSGVISIGKTGTTTSTGWTGELKETGTAGTYDAFNFTLSGTGAATITFEWDPSKVEVNKYFYLKDIVAFDATEVEYMEGTNDGWSRMVIHADSNKEWGKTDVTSGVYRSRYDFQIYKVGGNSPSSLDFINIKVGETPSRTNYWATCQITNATN